MSLITTVSNAAPFHCTTAPAAMPLPFTVIVVSPDPTGAESGVMSAIRAISPSVVVAQVLGLFHFAW
ncbi:MAG: hypothetical protein R6W76_22850 [Caldilinea sp.]